MAAPRGNQFWRARTKHGRDRLFASPEALWEACSEYFDWVEANPLHTTETVKYMGSARLVKVPKMRAMTIGGLCLFLDINRGTWNEWRSRDDYSEVIARAEEIIYDQKFSGAAADLLNSNIIARDLGLTDKREVRQSSTVKVSADMSPQEAARAYQDLMADD